MCAKKFICLIINVLCEKCVFLTVQFFDTTVHFLYTILLPSLHYPPVSVTHFSSSPYSYSLFYTVQSNVFEHLLNILLYHCLQSFGFYKSSFACF